MKILSLVILPHFKDSLLLEEVSVPLRGPIFDGSSWNLR